MDASAAWLVLGTVLGALLTATVVAGVLAYRRGTPPAAPDRPGPAPRVDDLADFLEHPPGTRTDRPGPAGWVALAAAPPAPAAPPPATAIGPDRTYLQLAALSLTALTLVGVAAAVAAATGTDGTGSPAPAGSAGPPVEPDGTRLDGELRAGGLVLEQRAVGVTATYPEMRLRADGSGTHVELRLPTWNCLSATAPDDPAAAGCVPSLVEHAELATPDLVVQRDGERIRLRGRAATELRPSGTPPEPSGHVYEFELTVTPGDGAGRPATGKVRIGTASAPLVEELSELDAD